jgi:hypothetical protein
MTRTLNAIIGKQWRHRVSRYLYCMLLCLILVSCSSSEVPVDLRLSFPSASPADKSAELLLTPELLAAKWDERMALGVSNTTELGGALALYAEQAMRSLFARVVVTRGERATGTSDLLVTLKLDSVNATKAVVSFENVEYTITVEWTAKNRNGQILWQQAITGESKGHAGNLLTYHSNREEALGELMKSLFIKSQAAMAAVPELRTVPRNSDLR